MTDFNKGRFFSLNTVSTLAVVFGISAAIAAAGMTYGSSAKATIPEVRSALPLQTAAVGVPTPSEAPADIQEPPAAADSPAQSPPEASTPLTGEATTGQTAVTAPTPDAPMPTTGDVDADVTSSDDEDHEVVRPEVRDEEDDEHDKDDS